MPSVSETGGGVMTKMVENNTTPEDEANKQERFGETHFR